MTRWPFRILLCLLLAVVTTVGVAWVVSIMPHNQETYFLSHAEFDRPLVDVFVHFDSTSLHISYGPRAMYTWAGPGPPYASVEELESVCPHRLGLENLRAVESKIVQSFGWPSVCLSTSHGFVTSDGGYREWDDALHVQGTSLPVRPRWPEFLYNTTTFGIVWFGLLFGLTATRRTLRRRRGHCPKCAYDLRGDFDNGCSECGWGRD